MTGPDDEGLPPPSDELYDEVPAGAGVRQSFSKGACTCTVHNSMRIIHQDIRYEVILPTVRLLLYLYSKIIVVDKIT